jgi:hypothetical protein
VATYTVVSRPLAEGLDLLQARGISICLVNFPFRTVRGYERHSVDTHSQIVHLLDDDGILRTDFRAAERSAIRVKGEPCRECSLDPVCSGPFRNYVARCGWSEIE